MDRVLLASVTDAPLPYSVLQDGLIHDQFDDMDDRGRCQPVQGGD
jgi:hypothetical protein